MSEEPRAGQALAGEGGPEAAATTPAARLAAYVQGGGVVVPVLTALLAFLVGGLVILVIYEGQIVGEFTPDVSEEELGIAMTGGGRQREAAA